LLLYQQRGKKHDKLAIKRLENSVEIINQQFSKLPVLEDFKILLSNTGKSDDTQTSEISETPQSSEIDSLHAKLDETLRSFSTLKKTLDEKDRDIRQLRKGIDAEIYKGMIKKFIRLEEVFHQEIDALSEDETKTKEVLSDMCEILQDTFFDCGVEEFSPEVGESIIDAFGTSDNYERIKIDDSSLHLQIAEVKRSGYFLNSANGRECLKKSEVKVFINMKNGEDK
jgi:molecular chaperone GrpE (heat shock protein)